MRFDSHASDVVAAAVGLVNALTPGWRRGREYFPPEEPERLRVVAHALRDWRAPVAAEVAELAQEAAALRVVFELLADGALDSACAEVNALLKRTEAVPVLSNHDGDEWHLHFHAMDAGFARSWAAAMATALAVALGHGYADRLGVCSAEACDRVYVDVSRNGTRRFCSTACQNRVKAAEFRRRKSAVQD
ncbi:putative RNA-binding Zn ribbon-like protein [Tamaricihabitans halophyticus]|uniref:Putative RNA-binding Zn ribbon-like protein n=1 Tax=Tamaricihabitans halophyticus TaxID=1262583 RepID=A0A4R2R6C6_9PSEU|nr:putative RNA-binding Zn ribbon-like protein [Tamaricihabitans halophyticus]